MSESKIAIFQKKEIRKTIHNNEWWFSVSDIIYALTESADPKQYIKKLRARDAELDAKWGTICTPLPIPAPDGKIRATNCANTEGIFRIIQSTPSPKAEPFKLWLAKVGYERVQEIENPELAANRMRMLYKAKGYPESWIDKRMRGIVIREELTDEWGKRGAQNKDYGILTAEISEATFGMTPREYKKFKNIKRENLRDHMNDLELIFTMLGERTTTEITKTEDSKGVPKLKKDAKEGGNIAGIAKNRLEKRIGRPISSKENCLKKQKKLS